MSYPPVKKTDYFCSIPGEVLDVDVSDIMRIEINHRLYIKITIRHSNPTADLGWSNFQFMIPLEGYHDLRDELLKEPRFL